METIRKTVESKYAPKQTNVIWVDTSGDTPVEKHFIKGKWREMSGGGSSSITVDPTNPPTELKPNTIYNYGILNDDTTFPQLKDSETNGNVYCWFFWTGSTVPEITVPENLIWANGEEPMWSENKYYEITVMNNVATCLEIDYEYQE